jgi:hypothetical protein
MVAKTKTKRDANRRNRRKSRTRQHQVGKLVERAQRADYFSTIPQLQAPNST